MESSFKKITIPNLYSEFKVFYTSSNQLLNNRDNLLMQIAETPPDIILITEVIPKAQINPSIFPIAGRVFILFLA